MPSAQSQHKGGGLRPPAQRGGGLRPPPFVVSFALALNTVSYCRDARHVFCWEPRHLPCWDTRHVLCWELGHELCSEPTQRRRPSAASTKGGPGGPGGVSEPTRPRQIDLNKMSAVWNFEISIFYKFKVSEVQHTNQVFVSVWLSFWSTNTKTRKILTNSI